MVRKIASIAIITFIIGFMYANKSFFILQEFFSDQIIKEEKEVSLDIVILGIDDKSLEEIGKWPWPRSIIAETSEKIVEAGAKSVFVDVLYTESSQNVEEDKVLERVVQEHDNIYLAGNFVFASKQQEGTVGALDFSEFNKPAISIDTDQVGHINVFPDRDRVVRNIALGIPGEENQMIPAMSVKIANLILEEEGSPITWTDNNEWFMGNEKLPTSSRNELRFSYATEPTENSTEQTKKFDTFSISEVVNGNLPPEYFHNKLVFIGPYAVGLQDQYYTSMSKTTAMYGVEIHANIVQSLLDKTFYSKTSTSTGLMIIFFMITSSFVVIDRFKATWAFVAYAGFVIAYYIAAVIYYDVQSVVLPLFYVLLALTIVYITSVVSQYILERKEKSRVTNLFGRYVSKGVVDEILASKEEVKLGGERKEVTMVFVDIRGFTPLSEKMEPEEVIVILNEYLDLCTRAVFEYEGTLDKFMGDGVMAIFGAPIEQEDHAIRAVRAALRMKANSGAMEKRLEEKYGRSVSFGVGINSGPAVIGNIGSHDRLDYTAIGDTVNLSARLESNAKPGQILISENTYNMVKEVFEVTALDAIKVKGKEKPVTIYQVEGEK